MTKEILYRLRSPWRYYQIKDGSGFLCIINWGIPAIGAAICSALVWMWACGMSTEVLFILRFKDVLCLLPGFFIAALSAVAVFDRAGMDDEMPGSKVTVRLVINGVRDFYIVSRRRFLCMTFSFLAAQSLSLTLILLAIPVRFYKVSPCLNAILSFVFLILFIQMITVALHGLYYLSEKLLNSNG